MSHLAREELESLNADLFRIGRQETLRHLLLCSACRKRAAALQLLDEEETWEEAPVAFSGKVLHRAVKVLEERYARSCEEQAAAGPLCDELLALPAAARRERLAADASYASAAVAQRLLDSAAACCAGDPRQAAILAELALTISKRLPVPGGVERAALLGRAHLWRGEAERVRGNAAAAEETYLQAGPELETLPLLSPERAEHCRLLARLRRQQGRNEEALALLARAVELYQEMSEPRRTAECRLEQGWMLLSELEAEKALPAFEEAAAWFQDPGDFPAWLDARSGLALCYADLGFAERARTIAGELHRETSRRSANDRLQVLRAEARIEEALGDDGRAAAILAEAGPRSQAEDEAREAP